MKVLLCPLGTHGDVHPLVGLGAELARRGHRVSVIANPAFRKLSERVGLAFVPVGSAERFAEAQANPNVWHPRRGLRILFRYLVQELRPLYEALVELYEPGQTVAVNSPIALGARLAQEKLGLPLATLHIAPMSIRSSILPPVLAGAPPMPRWAPRWYSQALTWLGDTLLVDPHLCGPLNEFRAELGLAPVRRVCHGWWDSPQRILAVFPPWFGPPQADWPQQVRQTGFPLWDERTVAPPDPELEAFLAAGEPPLVFTPGSAMQHGRKFFEAALGACQSLQRRGLFLSRFAEHIPPSLPETIRHFHYIPFSQVLPRTAAVAHHGGAGTTGQALAAGIPQLIMPMGFDQPDNAARVCRLGVGATLYPRHFTADNVAAALPRLLQPRVQQTCREIAARFAGEDAIGRTCDLVEELLPRSQANPQRRVA